MEEQGEKEGRVTNTIIPPDQHGPAQKCTLSSLICQTKQYIYIFFFETAIIVSFMDIDLKR